MTTSLRCLVLGWHRWSYAIMPAYEGVVTRACRRCHKLDIHLAEPAEEQLQRIDDVEKISHLFRRGWPR
jgi:hypothetical protein